MPANPLAEADSPPHPGCRAHPATRSNSRSQQRIPRRSGISREQPSRPRPRNYSWAELMRRVWAVDVLQCPRCSGGMRIVAAIHPPAAIRVILDCLGLPSRAPPIAAAAEREERNEWEVC